MRVLRNPFRGNGLPADARLADGPINADASPVLALLSRCPAHAATPLRDLPALATVLGVGRCLVKDESDRMGLGSFKALGAAHVIAREAATRRDHPGRPATREELAGALAGTVYACASAGNHGQSVAAGARLFGAAAVIYLADSVPEAFAIRLRRLGARTVRPGGEYEAAMARAAADAEANGWVLLSDSSWAGYTELPARVMEGYLVMGAEVAGSLPVPPTHLFLQAGVGGLAAAMSVFARARWGDAPCIVVVEPEAAPALLESVRAGRPVEAPGPVSNMGRLDCKVPSHLALGALARDADLFVTVSDAAAAAAVALLAGHGMATTPSGAAGLAAVHEAGPARAALGLDGDSRVLAFVTEGRVEET